MIFQHAYRSRPIRSTRRRPACRRRWCNRQPMMAEDPDHRYTDCTAALADIQSYRQGGRWRRRDRQPSWTNRRFAGRGGVAAELAGSSIRVAGRFATGRRRSSARYGARVRPGTRGTTHQMDAAVRQLLSGGATDWRSCGRKPGTWKPSCRNSSRRTWQRSGPGRIGGQ